MLSLMEILTYNFTLKMAANLLIKGYCDYTTSLFFRDIEIVHPENVPQKGPTIVYSNHNNQFIDGMVLNMQRSCSIVACLDKFILWPLLSL